MELTLSELQEMATRQQQQIEAQQQMLVAKVTPSFESLCVENVGFFSRFSTLAALVMTQCQ